MTKRSRGAKFSVQSGAILIHDSRRAAFAFCFPVSTTTNLTIKHSFHKTHRVKFRIAQHTMESRPCSLFPSQPDRLLEIAIDSRKTMQTEVGWAADVMGRCTLYNLCTSTHHIYDSWVSWDRASLNRSRWPIMYAPMRDRRLFSTTILISNTYTQTW